MQPATQASPAAPEIDPELAGAQAAPAPETSPAPEFGPEFALENGPENGPAFAPEIAPENGPELDLKVAPVLKTLAQSDERRAAVGEAYEPLRSAIDLARERLALGRRVSEVQNAKIMGACPQHGPYTREACRRFGLFDECPDCHIAAARATHAARAALLAAQESGIPLRFAQKSFADFQPPTPQAAAHKKVLESYAQNFPDHARIGRSLVLCGGMGTGKTMLACAVGLRAALHFAKTVRYTTAYRLTQDIKDTYGTGRKEADAAAAFTQPDLLIIDEVGVQFGSAAEAVLLFAVLNNRYENLRPSIIISNVTPAELGQYLGDRVVDRLRENDGGVLVFNWESWRK